MSSSTAAQVLIVTTAGVYIFLAVMTGVLLGGDGFKLFLTTSSAGLSSLVSTVWAGLVSLSSTVWAGLVSLSSTVWAGLVSLSSIVWAGLVSLSSTVWAGLVSFVAAAPAHTEMMRLSFLSTVEFFFSPWSLMVVYTMFFTGLCTLNWKETKSASSAVYKVASEATRAVWAVLSNPHKMLQYGMFVVMVRLFPDVVERLTIRQ